MSYTKIERLKKELDHAISENDFDLALEAVDDMLDLDPENDQFWNSRGVILAKLDRIEESIEAFDMGLKIDPDAPKIWYSKGVILMENGSQRAALGCFYKALDLDPVYSRAKERFNKCLDDLILMRQSEIEDRAIENEPEMTGGDDLGEGHLEESESEMEPEPEIIEPKAKKRKGTYLDDEMFIERRRRKIEEEEWEEMDEEEESWSMEEEDEDEMDTIKCRCGATILIESRERPYRFECEDCGRTGTLR